VPAMSNSEEKKVESYMNPGKVSIAYMRHNYTTVMSGVRTDVLNQFRNMGLPCTQGNFRNTLAETLEHAARCLRNGTLPWLPSFLSGFLQGNSDAMGVVAEFLTLPDIWRLSKTSTKNWEALKDDTINKSHCLMAEGLVVWYLNYSGEWVLAIVACVVNDGTGNQAYHMTPIDGGDAETLFDHEVPCRSSTDPRYPDNSVKLEFDTRHGNSGSNTSKNPHKFCREGFSGLSCHAPIAFWGTVDPRCSVFTNASLRGITEKDVGCVINTKNFITDETHRKAIRYLTERRPGVPVNRPNGYSPADARALGAHRDVVRRALMYTGNGYAGNGYAGNGYAQRALSISLGKLYAAMPDIPQSESKEDDKPCVCWDYHQSDPYRNQSRDAWNPGNPNPHAFHYLDNRTGNWGVGSWVTPADRTVEWTPGITTHIVSGEDW
jgi:hypothetical protein